MPLSLSPGPVPHLRPGGAVPASGSTHLPSSFATTRWSVVLAAAGPEAQIPLNQLCRAYWKPLFAFARRLGHSEHDAQDLTQAFFEHFLQKAYIRAADPERGRFRTFLLTAFRHFIRAEWLKARATKRGGGANLVPWETLSSAEELQAGLEGLPASAAYDQQWALTVFAAALAGLRAEFIAAGKAQQFEQLKPFLSQLGNTADYERVGQECGISAGAVAVAVRRFRVRYGELLRAEIAETVAQPKDIEDELQILKKVLIS